MRNYRIEITGTQPLLMHHDDIEWADVMDSWRNDPKNKKSSKAGDDRTPAHRWIGSLYHDNGKLVIPSENIMRAIMEGAAMVLVPGGKSGKTFKSQSQSGIVPASVGWPLIVGDKEIPSSKILELAVVSDFSIHKEMVLSLGFSLFLKRARIGTQKHIRVRPRFDIWAAAGELAVIDDQITTEVLTSILQCAGTYKGLCDWRPGSKTPGSFGTFVANVQKL